MTHAELVKLAASWLTRTQRCSVVITEMATTGEEPDAIGWNRNESVLVECKTSRSDFFTDFGKPHRMMQAYGVGKLRYYLTLPGVIRMTELPACWGLLEVTGTKIRLARKAEPQPAWNHRQETRMLVSALRRIGTNPPAGTSIKCYTIETRNRAELHVEPE